MAGSPSSAGSDPYGFSSLVQAYFAGQLSALETVPVETGGTDFQQRVWAALRRIAPGRTITYTELASAAERPSAVRAAGSSNALNPISIAIPCHRVIGKDSSLTGYGGGLWRKRWLLKHEGVVLFDRLDRHRSAVAAQS